MATEEKSTELAPEEEKAAAAGEEELEKLLEEEPEATIETEAKEEEAEEVPAEEAKPEIRKKKEKEEEIVEERVYTIPLGKASVRPPKKRAPRAVQLIRAFIVKHMKLEMRIEEEEEREELPKLIISQEVNEKVWGRGIEKPPRKIRVRAAKDKDGNVTVYLTEKA